MRTELLLYGTKANIHILIDDHDRKPAKDFLESLNPIDLKKVSALLRKFAEAGEIRNSEQFKCVQSPIFEFKSHQVRICCFFLSNFSIKTIVLTHGFTKKSPKMPPAELDRALAYYSQIVNK